MKNIDLELVGYGAFKTLSSKYFGLDAIGQYLLTLFGQLPTLLAIWNYTEQFFLRPGQHQLVILSNYAKSCYYPDGLVADGDIKGSLKCKYLCSLQENLLFCVQSKG